MLNLIDGGFQNSNLFMHMPLYDVINYVGLREGRVRHYRAVREDQPCTILSLSIIRRDEEEFLDAVEDFIKRSVQQAALAVHGVYVFDLLTIDIHKEVKTFNLNELTTMIVNHARKLREGVTRLIKYSSAYGLLQKMVHEDWGKITLKTAMDVFKDKSVFLDILVKQLTRDFAFSHDPAVLMLNDLSLQPLYDPQDVQQQKRLSAVMAEQIPKTIEYPPEVYIQDINGVRELLSGSVIK